MSIHHVSSVPRELNPKAITSLEKHANFRTDGSQQAGAAASVEHGPFELQRIDLVLDKLKERGEFRSHLHIGRSLLGESFLELRRGWEYNINLKEVDSPCQLERRARGAFLHIPAERKDDKRIDLKASERADDQNQTLTST